MLFQDLLSVVSALTSESQEELLRMLPGVRSIDDIASVHLDRPEVYQKLIELGILSASQDSMVSNEYTFDDLPDESSTDFSNLLDNEA